jgi:solute carrier family 25 carnitine/acylcarnitine transporter 20/29
MAEISEQHLENLPLISTQILKDFTAGILANCLGTFIGHPLDTVKVRMQLSNVNPPVYTLIKRIIHTEGISGLFKGVASPLLGQAPISASAFMANDFAKRALMKADMSKNQKNFIAGCFTGFVSTVFTTPIEYIKIKKQAHHGESLTYLQILKEEGIRKTFKGFSSTVMRDVPGWCSYFFAYDFLKHQFEKYFTNEEGKKRTFLCQSLAGGFAGQISWTLCYPAD